MNKLILILVLVAPAAFAGPAEREFVTKQLTPAISEAEAAFKSKCGCPLKITYADDLKTEDHLRLVRSMANSVTEGVKYCTDAASKKAVCQMKSLNLTLGKTTEFNFAGGRGLASTEGQSYPTFDNMMTDKLDK